jgi:signal transduction histidine kinase
VVALFAVIYWSAIAYADQDETDEIKVEFHAIVDEAGLAGYSKLPLIIGDHLRQREGTRVAYLLEDASGNKIAGNVDPLPPSEGAVTIQPRLNGKLAKVRAYFFRMPNGDYLLIGEASSTLREMKASITRAFGVSAITTILLGLIGGAMMSSSILRRVEVVSRTSRAIVAGNLSQRVPVRGSDDEFDHLAGSVNAMLDRIEDLMRTMRRVSNDVAHDLRTPLTRLRQRLELARARDHTVGELQEVLDDAIKNVDAILDTFSALLRIAQIEAGQGIRRASAVDLTALLQSIVADFTPAAEDRGQKLIGDIDPGLIVVGDRELLAQMAVNLLENAIRHVPEGAEIWCRAGNDPDGVAITVADSGPGIPPEERENVLRPFYRLESSRTTPGSGLGFSLVSVIVKHHAAQLFLEDNEPGLKVRVVFPPP